jgi:GNAT superfamily N-acetyltransferase
MAAHLARSYGPLQQARELADPSIFTLVADTGDELAGYAQLRRGPAPTCVTGDTPMELWRFYIAQQWHGRGLAQELMQHVEAVAEDPPIQWTA